VNQYKTAYYCLGQSYLVVFVYSQLSSGSIQPTPLLELAVPTIFIFSFLCFGSAFATFAFDYWTMAEILSPGYCAHKS